MCLLISSLPQLTVENIVSTIKYIYYKLLKFPPYLVFRNSLIPPLVLHHRSQTHDYISVQIDEELLIIK